MVSRRTRVIGNRYSIVAVITAIGAVLLLTQRAISMYHWNSIGWDMGSYSPWLLPLVWLSLIIYWYVTLRKKVHWYYKVLGLGWLVYQIFWTYGIILTYFVII